MAQQQHVFLVSKTDNTKYALGTIPGPDNSVQSGQTTTPPLAPSSVRARTSLISLTSNNLTYAQGGSAPPLFWWDAYPVPSNTALTSPSPHDAPTTTDLNTTWGIVPAWGYATILASTIPSLKPATLLWGFFPASGHTFDLRLEEATNSPTTGEAHYQEISPHRSRLMTLYNTYIYPTNPPRLSTSLSGADSDADNLRVLCRPVWKAGYLLNRFVFPAPSSGITPVHPLGIPGAAGGEAWTDELAGLARAVVVSLGAGTKTGRSFGWCIARDRDVSKGGPVGLVQVTSRPETLGRYEGSEIKVKNVGYGKGEEGLMGGGLEWVLGLRPERVVVVDFGARGGVLEEFIGAVKGKGLNVTVIAVGTESKIYSKEEMGAHMASAKTLGKWQMNTSPLVDRAVEAVGLDELFKGVDEAYERCVGEKGLGDVEVVKFDGVVGDKGIEGAWRALCESKLAANAGIVVKLDSITWV